MKKLLLVIFLNTINKAFNDNDLAEYDLGLDLGGDYEDDEEFFEQAKKSRTENVKKSEKNGGSFYLYDYNSGFFGKAKRKDMYCEGSFCMQKEKLVLEQMLDKDNEYRKVQNEEMISQCAPSLGVKVIHNSVRLFFFINILGFFRLCQKLQWFN